MSLTWHEREKASKINVPKPVPDERPWKLKAFIALGLMIWFWWQVAKWL